MLTRIVLILLTATLMSCSSKEKPAVGRFRYPLLTDPLIAAPFLDPALATSQEALLLLSNLNEGLVQTDEKGIIQPALAEKWEVSASGRTYVFHLRDAKWSDGAPVTPDDFIYAWQRVLDPATQSPYQGFLKDVDNADLLIEGKPGMEVKLGMKAVDGKRLEVRLRAPAADFLARVGHPALSPLRRDMKEMRPEDHATFPQFRTTGAFRLAQSTPGASIRLEANPYYYGTQSQIQTLDFPIVSDAKESFKKYEDQELDALFVNTHPEKESFRTRNDHRLVPSLEISFLLINTEVKPFDEKGIRRAFSYAANRKEVGQLLKLNAQTSRAWIPSGVVGHELHVGLDFNPAMAKAYLHKSAFRELVNFPAVGISYEDDELSRAASERLQSTWRTLLGIPSIELIAHVAEPVDERKENKPAKSAKDAKPKDPIVVPAFIPMSYRAPYSDPQPYLEYFRTGDRPSLWKSGAYDSIVSSAGHSQNEEERIRLVRKAQRYLLEDEAAVIPLFQKHEEYLVQPYVRNLVIDSRGILHFAKAVIDFENQPKSE